MKIRWAEHYSTPVGVKWEKTHKIYLDRDVNNERSDLARDLNLVLDQFGKGNPERATKWLVKIVEELEAKSK